VSPKISTNLEIYRSRGRPQFDTRYAAVERETAGEKEREREREREREIERERERERERENKLHIA